MSTGNNTSVPLAADATFTGLAQLTTGFTNILISIKLDKRSELTIQQSANKVHWDLDSVWTCDPAKDPSGFTIQTPVALPYFRVILHNTTAENMTVLRLVSVLNLTSNVKLTPQQDNTLVSGEDAEKKKRTVQTTSTGDLIINGTGGSATRPVYLMEVGTFYRVASVGNTAGHVWNSIGAIVGGETEPTIGRLFKCLFVPANVEGQGTVYDVEFTDTVNVVSVGGVQAVSGTVSVDNFPSYPSSIEVSNFPSTQSISGSVSLLASADPTIELGKVRITDSYGAGISATAGNVMVGINNIYTVNPLHTIVDSGSITTIENPSLLISFDSGNTVRNIKASAGSLQSLSLVNDNNSLAFVALYNALAIDVTAGTTVPYAVIVIQKDQAIQLATHNATFSTAISFFTATTYNGGVALTNVYVTAAYDG